MTASVRGQGLKRFLSWGSGKSDAALAAFFAAERFFYTAAARTKEVMDTNEGPVTFDDRIDSGVDRLRKNLFGQPNRFP